MHVPKDSPGQRSLSHALKTLQMASLAVQSYTAVFTCESCSKAKTPNFPASAMPLTIQLQAEQNATAWLPALSVASCNKATHGNVGRDNQQIKTASYLSRWSVNGALPTLLNQFLQTPSAHRSETQKAVDQQYPLQHACWSQHVSNVCQDRTIVASRRRALGGILPYPPWNVHLYGPLLAHLKEVIS